MAKKPTNSGPENIVAIDSQIDRTPKTLDVQAFEDCMADIVSSEWKKHDSEKEDRGQVRISSLSALKTKTSLSFQKKADLEVEQKTQPNVRAFKRPYK